jgi:hypothetical protein
VGGRAARASATSQEGPNEPGEGGRRGCTSDLSVPSPAPDVRMIATNCMIWIEYVQILFPQAILHDSIKRLPQAILHDSIKRL